MTPKTRWMIRRDMPEVLAIENAYPLPWCEEDFLSLLRQRNCIGMVAENADEDVVGFMIYELHKSRLDVLNFAVHPAERRKGVGHALLERLKDKLTQQRRNELTFTVRESNLSMQLFLKAGGFFAEDVLRGHYDNDEDGYTFSYLLESAEMSAPNPK